MNGKTPAGAVVQVVLTIGLAALAAFSGLKVGLAESQATLTAMQQRMDSQDLRLIRMDEKLDWLMRHEVERAEHLPH